MVEDLGGIKIPVTFEMTDISKVVLRNEFLKLLEEPEVLKVLVEALEQKFAAEWEAKSPIRNHSIYDADGNEIARAKGM
jgi:hypothetical protein